MSLRTDLVEKRGVLDAKRKTLADVFTEAGNDLDMDKVKSLTGTSGEKAAGIRSLHDEINDLGAEVDNLAAAVKAADSARKTEDEDERGMKHSGGPTRDKEHPNFGKSLGELFVETKAYTGRSGSVGPQSDIDVPDIKTLMTTSAGWAPESLRTGRVVPFATRPIQVTDLMPLGRTSMASVKYMEETTFTNSAAETSETATYAESALALTERSSPTQKVATFLPVTDEQLEDVDGIQSYIDNRLTFMIRQRLDSQLIVGNGTPPNLKGILNVSGIQTQAKGADPTPDSIYKAMVLVMVTGRAQPNGFICHPLDWQDVKLLRTADGIYIWGNPADAAPDRIWGLNVAVADAITQNTGLVGDFQTHCELLMRRDIQVQVSNSHSTFFIEGKQAIRADMRCAFVVYRPAAFCTVTGI